LIWRKGSSIVTDSDAYAGRAASGKSFLGLLEIRRERLFTKNCPLVGTGRLDEETGMQIGRGQNQERIDAGVRNDVVGGHGGCAVLPGNGFGFFMLARRYRNERRGVAERARDRRQVDARHGAGAAEDADA